MVRTMVDRADQRSVMLFYCNQTWDAVTFREEIEVLKKENNLKVIYTIERPPDKWQEESGFLNIGILKNI